jgi:hypothetical protein
VTPDDSVTEIPDESTADLGSEDQASNTRAELIGPTLTGGDSEPTATDAEPTSAASGGADSDEDSDQGTDDPEPSPTEALETGGKEDQPDSPSETGDAGNSPQTTGLSEEPQETEEADSDQNPPSTGSSGESIQASAPAATDKSGFTTVTGSKPAPTEEAYDVPVDLEEDTVLGDYAEFKEASDGDQVV